MILSPGTSYYLRQILSRYHYRLKSVFATNAALEAHCLSDLNVVIMSLYLDDEIALEIINKLENLVKLHQVLKEQGELYLQYQIETEKEMLWLLGFKVLEISLN